MPSTGDAPVFFPTTQISGTDLNRVINWVKGALNPLSTTPTSTTQPSSGPPTSVPLGTPTGGGGTPAPVTGVVITQTGIDLVAQVNNAFVILNWNQNIGTDYVMTYELRWRDAADAVPNYQNVLVGGGTTNRKIPNLYPGHTYVFQVRALNGAGRFGLWSAECPAPIGADSTAPPVPTGLTAFAATKGVKLIWTPVAGAQAGDLASYDVAISTDGGFTFPTIVNSDNGAYFFWSYTSMNPADNQAALRFMVRSKDWSGNTSLWSNPGTGGTAGQPPYSGAGGVAATVGGLAWDEVTVGSIRSIGTIGAAGGFTTRIAGVGVGVDIKTAGISGWNSSNQQTFFLESATGNVTINGLNATATIQGATVIGSTIETRANVPSLGGSMMDNSGIRVVADGSSTMPQGTVTWYANNNGQFLSAQTRTIGFGYCPVDGSNPMRLNFQIGPQTVRLVKITISFYIDSFKVGNQVTAASGSSHAHTVSGSTSGTESGGHSHLITWPTGAVVSYTAGWDISGNATTGSGSFTGAIATGSENAAHSHGVSGATSSSESSHTHNLNAPTALYNAGGASAAHVQLFDSVGTPLANLGPYGSGPGQFISDIDLTPYIPSNATGWFQILLSTATLGGFEAQINIREIVQSI